MADILIVPMTENMERPIELARELRKLAVNVEVYLNDKKLKAKMKYADKLRIPYVLVIGDDEISSNQVKVKNMESGEEVQVNLEAKEIESIIRK